MKKLEIEKTKPTFIISVLKVEYKVGLVFSISNFFINKSSLANNWMSFSCSNSDLETYQCSELAHVLVIQKAESLVDVMHHPCICVDIETVDHVLHHGSPFKDAEPNIGT